MTDHTTAAQAAMQETVLPPGQILSLERRSNMTDDEALRFGRAVESALLSKLRAPVADIPRAVFALEHIAAWAGTGPGLKTHKEVRAYAKHNAAQASAPVAGEAQPSDIDILGLAGLYLEPARPTTGAQVVNFSRALLRNYAAPQASAETLVRYCPGCGSIGPVEEKYRDCCPDGNQARMIPAPLAEKCRDTFRIAIKVLLADAAANDSGAPPASEAVRDALETLIREAQAVADDYHRPRYARLDEAIQSARAALSAQPGAQKDGGINA